MTKSLDAESFTTPDLKTIADFFKNSTIGKRWLRLMSRSRSHGPKTTPPSPWLVFFAVFTYSVLIPKGSSSLAYLDAFWMCASIFVAIHLLSSR